MRTIGTGSTLGVLVRRALAFLVLAGALHASATETPQPVSPGANSPGAVAEARCPTFSWAGVPGATGYELAVFRVSAVPAAEPVLVTRASLPQNAQTWTPPVGQCLERGERYAWSVAAAASASGDQLDWASALLFEVESAPSLDELEHAVATIQRYLAGDRDGAALRGRGAPSRGELPALEGAGAEAPRAADARLPRVPAPGPGSFLPGPLTTPTSAIRTASAATTPTLGVPSLTVANHIHLAAASDLFKDDAVLLWDDNSGNTALGRNALSSVSGTATNNTALGREALENTTGGGSSWLGSLNTAVGDRALRYNTTGFRNTASGFYALRSNTTGYFNTASGANALRSNDTGIRNTASGYAALFSNTTGYSNTAGGAFALRSNTTGDRNTALGYRAGYGNSTGNDSIFINNDGSGNAGPTIRIGTQGTQTTTFIAGIRGVTALPADAITVLISSTGQLGTASSSRSLKQDIQDLGPLADRLLELRPVAFRFKEHAAADPDTPLQFGLIAEEVAEVFPELVVYDEEGKPETVKYHLLSSLLLGELQRVRAEHQAELRDVGDRLAALESRSPRATNKRRGADLERGRR